MRNIKLTESDLVRLINKIIMVEQTEEPEEEEKNFLLNLRKFIRGKLSYNDLYELHNDITDIRVREPKGQSLMTIKIDDRENFLEETGITSDDLWFRSVLISPYSSGFEFIDSYTILDEFSEGYIFEYLLNEENTQTLKDIAGILIPDKKVDLDDEEYIKQLHKILLNIFPKQIDFILGDYEVEKNNEMSTAAIESINSEFDDKLKEIGVRFDNNMEEVTIPLSELYSGALQLNLFNLTAGEMVVKIISNKLGGSNSGGWYENNYEYQDSTKFDKESFNRSVQYQFEKMIEILDEKNDNKHTFKDYAEFVNRITSEFNSNTWYETPKDKNILFSVQKFNYENMTITLVIKNRGTSNSKTVKMNEEQFTQFLYQPSLFNLEDMY